MAVLPLIFVKHDSMAPSVNERCTGPQPGDGCGATFPYKTNAGLCARCHLLDEQTTPDEARRTILGVCYLLSFPPDCRPQAHLSDVLQEYPQCMECGAIGKTFRENHCGACAQRCMASKIHVLLFDLLMSSQYCKVKARAPSLKIWTGTVGMLFKLA